MRQAAATRLKKKLLVRIRGPGASDNRLSSPTELLRSHEGHQAADQHQGNVPRNLTTWTEGHSRWAVASHLKVEKNRAVTDPLSRSRPGRVNIDQTSLLGPVLSSNEEIFM